MAVELRTSVRLAGCQAERRRIRAGKIPNSGVARHLELMGAVGPNHDAFVARARSRIEQPTILAVRDRAERHVVESLGVAVAGEQREVLDVGRQREAGGGADLVGALVRSLDNGVAAADVIDVVAGSAGK